MRKILLTIFILFISIPVMASFNPISDVISNSGLDRNSIVSVSVKDINSSDEIYKKRADMLLNPASVLKIFTMASSISTLGDEYNFETAVYLDKANNDLYLKLGGDPLFKTNDLNSLINQLKLSYKGKIRHFYIDDTIIDKKSYPDGWTIDDFWPNSPMISPYMIDNNTVSVYLSVLHGQKSVLIRQPSTYQFAFINKIEVDKSKKNSVIPKLDYGENSNIVTLSGNINGDIKYDIPVISPKVFYITKLSDALVKYNIPYSKQFYFKSVPDNARKIVSIKHPMKDVVSYTLEKSDNTCAEMIFKVAANYYSKKNPDILSKGGTTENGAKMFYDFYQNAGIKVDNIKIADASGVSRYNALSTDWISDALIYLNKNSLIKDYMVKPGEGTLKNRMSHLSDCVRAKTGTIFGTSSLAGYIDTLSGKHLVFAIIIQNFEKRPSVIKGLEDDIVNAIWEL